MYVPSQICGNRGCRVLTLASGTGERAKRKLRAQFRTAGNTETVRSLQRQAQDLDDIEQMLTDARRRMGLI